MKPALVLSCSLVALPGAVLWGQPSPRLSARELFYTPPPQKVASVTPKEVRKAAPPARRRTQPPLSAPDTTPVIPAVQQSGIPLGVRYSLLRATSGGATEEVDPDMVFHSGDGIAVSVQPNDSAFLYVVARGSSGAWKVLFPSEEISGGSNQVERLRAYQVPPGGRFVFHGEPGEEKLFLVLSRQPEPDLEKLIYSLSKPVGAPAAEPPRKELLLAQNVSIDDALVNRIRGQLLARDLVFEKVDERSSGERKEKAVYVVNPSSAADSRLVVDLSLKHR